MSCDAASYRSSFGSSFPRKIALLLCCLAVAGCSGNRAATRSASDYVEIDNPTVTMSGDAPAKIWVPRSYVESGVPRGGELLKKGTEEIAGSLKKSHGEERKTGPAQPSVIAAANLPPSAAGTSAAGRPPLPLRTRIALVEIGHGQSVLPLYRELRKSGKAVVLDPARFAARAGEAGLADPAGKAAFAARVQEDAGANVVVYVTAPKGAGAGNPLSAEVFDALGGGLLRSFTATVPPFPATDPAARDAAVSAALSSIAEKITDLVSFLPWFGRITEVDGDRAYIAAGKETGLRIGQVLQVYRGGKFVKGLGFAPGERVGTLAVAGFVGPDGSFCILRKEQRVRPADLVSAE